MLGEAPKNAAGSKTAAMLTDALAKAKELGHEYVLLVGGRRGGNSPRNWTRCRVITGKPCLMGRCVGPGRVMGTWLFEVRVSELQAWLWLKTRKGSGGGGEAGPVRGAGEREG